MYLDLVGVTCRDCEELSVNIRCSGLRGEWESSLYLSDGEMKLEMKHVSHLERNWYTNFCHKIILGMCCILHLEQVTNSFT